MPKPVHTYSIETAPGRAPSKPRSRWVCSCGTMMRGWDSPARAAELGDEHLKTHREVAS